MIAQTLLTGVTILLVKLANAEYEVDMYCELIPAGSKLASLENCQDYYICLPNQKAFKSTCPNNSVFDRNSQSCVPQSDSNCHFGQANPCANKHEKLTYSNKGCNWFNWCMNGKIADSGTCNPGQKFNVVTGNCTYGKCDSSKTNGVQDICDIMPDGAYFGDFENCAAWHRCDNMDETSGVCYNDLVFDPVSGGCRENKGKMCQRTKDVVKNMPSGPPSEQCNDVGQIVGDANICSRYYACEIYTYVPEAKYRWVAKGCRNLYFDVISQTCSSIYSARTFPTCDRCELVRSSKSTYFVNAAEPSCNKYFTCKNGRKDGNELKTCPQWQYFNEIVQACDGNEERWEQYEENEGACQDYDCNLESRECYMVSAAPEA